MFLMITAALPCAQPDNAGGRYVKWVTEAASRHHEVFVLAPEGPASLRARKAGGAPRHKLLGGAPVRGVGTTGRVLSRLLSIVAPLLPPWRFLLGLLYDRQARESVRRAEIIDLQWEEYGLLIPALRRYNPGALIVCTFHDVLSQRYGRASEAAASKARRLRWAWAASMARWTERKILRHADRVVVLSEKDADLLPPGTADIRVITPPLGVDLDGVDRSAPVPGEVLFVGFLARWENEDGLLWFLHDVWPLITASAPGARFRVAGLGVGPNVSEAARMADVELLGFVGDLKPLYERASVIVVPLRLGAGVKFKVVDALVAGVPIVTTAVGAEGIGDPSWFAGLHDDAEEFAEAVLRVLTAVDPVEVKEIQDKARNVYGWDQFEQAALEVYRRGPGKTQKKLRKASCGK